MQNIYLKKLHLNNYRNFANYEISIDNGIVVIVGDNGVGKTNILEAISMLAPGRGVRSAKLIDICPYTNINTKVDNFIRDSSIDWSFTARMQSKFNLADIKTFFKNSTNRRYVQFNDKVIPNNELGKLSNILWLTPQMDGLFLDSSSVRRKFFDRIVYNFEHIHAKNITQYDHYSHERTKILQQDFMDTNWLDSIEHNMAENAFKIAVSRINTLHKIQQAMNDLDTDFPKSILDIDGNIEKQVMAKSSNIVIDDIKSMFTTNRHKDKISGRVSYGINRSDFVVINKQNNQLAKFCSTGQQKALLVSIIIAQIIAIIKETSCTPIILFDEVFTHLDQCRRHYLTNLFLSLTLQVWVTSTDLHGLDKLAQHSQIISL